MMVLLVSLSTAVCLVAVGKFAKYVYRVAVMKHALRMEGWTD